MQVSPDLEQGYAFYPVYSPDGTEVAYADQPGQTRRAHSTRWWCRT